MTNTTSINPESLIRKNPLRARYSNLSPKSRKRFKAEYMEEFEIKERPFHHRESGRTSISKEEEKWINAWKFKK